MDILAVYFTSIYAYTARAVLHRSVSISTRGTDPGVKPKIHRQQKIQLTKNVNDTGKLPDYGKGSAENRLFPQKKQKKRSPVKLETQPVRKELNYILLIVSFIIVSLAMLSFIMVSFIIVLFMEESAMVESASFAFFSEQAATESDRARAKKPNLNAFFILFCFEVRINYLSVNTPEWIKVTPYQSKHFALFPSGVRIQYPAGSVYVLSAPTGKTVTGIWHSFQRQQASRRMVKKPISFPGRHIFFQQPQVKKAQYPRNQRCQQDTIFGLGYQ